MTSGYDYLLVVHGDPKAQKRHRTATRDKAGKALPFPRNYDDSHGDKADLNLIARAQADAPTQPLNGPLRVDLRLYFRRPKGHYGTGRHAGRLKSSAPLWYTSKPDRDNADKFVLDALKGVLWYDDKQICAGEITKQYSDCPRTEIGIRQLTNESKGTNDGDANDIHDGNGTRGEAQSLQGDTGRVAALF